MHVFAENNVKTPICMNGRASRAPEGAAEYWCYKKIFQTLRTIYFYEQSLSFWIFSSSFKTFKIPNFCQKRSLSSFSAHILSFWIFQALNFKRPYFCQKMSLSSFSPNIFHFLNILDEFCGADIINGTSKCKTFVDKCCKQQSLSEIYLRGKAKFFPVSLHL